MAVLRGVHKPRDEVAAEEATNEELQPELRTNPQWLQNLSTSRPGGERKVNGYTYNSWMQFHKDAAMSANTERERIRQVNLLREWVKDFYPREWSQGFYSADSHEDPPVPATR